MEFLQKFRKAEQNKDQGQKKESEPFDKSEHLGALPKTIILQIPLFPRFLLRRFTISIFFS